MRYPFMITLPGVIQAIYWLAYNGAIKAGDEARFIEAYTASEGDKSVLFHELREAVNDVNYERITKTLDMIIEHGVTFSNAIAVVA